MPYPFSRVAGRRVANEVSFLPSSGSKSPQRGGLLSESCKPNKLARIAWAVMRSGEEFRTHYGRPAAIAAS